MFDPDQFDDDPHDDLEPARRLIEGLALVLLLALLGSAAFIF